MTYSVAASAFKPAVSDPPFRVAVRREARRTWVTPVGELDLCTAGELDRELWKTQRDTANVVLDLRALTFLDSAGVRSLLAARLRASQSDGVLEVIVAGGQVRRMLAVSGIDSLLTLVEPLPWLRSVPTKGPGT